MLISIPLIHFMLVENICWCHNCRISVLGTVGFVHVPVCMTQLAVGIGRVKPERVSLVCTIFDHWSVDARVDTISVVLGLSLQLILLLLSVLSLRRSPSHLCIPVADFDACFCLVEVFIFFRSHIVFRFIRLIYRVITRKQLSLAIESALRSSQGCCPRAVSFEG